MKNNRFWNWVRNEETGASEMYLYGAIAESTWFEDDVTPAMFRSELQKHSGDVTVFINSPGGDVFAASQIYTMLRNHPGKVTVKIDGIAASAASVEARFPNANFHQRFSVLSFFLHFQRAGQQIAAIAVYSPV